MLVSDDGGKTWGEPIPVIPEEHRKGWACEECDAAELPGGDLFWAFRRCAPEHQVVWYENDVTPSDDNWAKHVICQPFPHAFEAVAGDLDGDGDLDVAVTSWGMYRARRPATPSSVLGKLAWLENTGDPKRRFTMHMIKDNWDHANQVIIADLDGDGKLDIAATAERYALEFRWWRNLGRSAE